ncbi:prenyltransferase/squalene oxidase repeat-containing protein [Frankia sp. Cj3]|uniref:prenyltransferase/squalene oxidase repeat-containing protein n=1 Tax=Frankia sp. Cj3 TaxID=2880976 RepID=UPI001EF614C2|nr:prenyltransferase/squalene oxidase repeat-containing protein [Frankia sp. Cj3]
MTRITRARDLTLASLERTLDAIPRRGLRRLAHATPSPDCMRAHRAVELGAAFLRRRQRQDGALRDFALEPGLSDAWMTAHVALVLEGVPKARQVQSRAAGYLFMQGCAKGAWGFNGRVREDADSTAQALIVLAGSGYAVPRAWRDTLLGFQHPNGGFSTYRCPTTGPVNGWQAPHADVTLAAHAALRDLDLDAATRAQAFLERLVANDGLATAYWWATPAYCLWAQVKFGFGGRQAGSKAAEELAGAPSGPLDVAMLGWAAASELTSSATADAVSYLLATQLVDGSWPCSPCLRVTDPALHSSRLKAPGRVYSGGRRVFSTAHAVAAVAKLHACPPVS